MTRRATLFRLLVFALALGIGLGADGRAQADVVDQIVAEMRAEGYEDVSVEQTLLGRTRIVGRAPGRRREVVVDQTTGEILRDLTEEDGSSLPPRPGARMHG